MKRMEIWYDTCVFDGCTRRRDADLRRGLCRTHYAYLRSKDALPSRPSLREMMLGEWRRVTEDGCWEWRGHITPEGYGKYRSRYLHRMSVEMFQGVAAGEDVDHLCRNTRCYNPDHLEPVTHAENVRRGAQSHILLTGCCAYGHEMTEGNSLIYVTKKGVARPFCRACRRRREAARYQRRCAARKAERDRANNADAARAARGAS